MRCPRKCGGVVVLVGLVAVACGGTPTQPTPVTTVVTASPAGPVLTTVRVAGHVADSDGNPVVGASVTRWDSLSERTVTDAQGAFTLLLAIKPLENAFWVTVAKAGFETSELYRPVETTRSLLLRLHPIQRVEAGTPVQAMIGPEDSACGYHWGYICRRVHVQATAAGTLTIEVVSLDGYDLGVAVGMFGTAQEPLASRYSTEVVPGADVAVDIVSDLTIDAAAGFTLNTSIVPR